MREIIDCVRDPEIRDRVRRAAEEEPSPEEQALRIQAMYGLDEGPDPIEKAKTEKAVADAARARWAAAKAQAEAIAAASKGMIQREADTPPPSAASPS